MAKESRMSECDRVKLSHGFVHLTGQTHMARCGFPLMFMKCGLNAGEM